MRSASAVAAVTLSSVCALTAPHALGASTGASARHPASIVSEEPASTTPHVLDGTVNSITRVGDLIVLGGSFTRVRNHDSSATLVRRHLLAFDATTGVVSPTFAPNPNGTVHKVQAAADGRSVYVGGRFTSAGGRAVKNLFLASVSRGRLSRTFKAPRLNGDVRDLEVVRGRLWVAGKFTRIGERRQAALGTLNATTGSYTSFFTGRIAGRHNPRLTASGTNVLQISTDRSNRQLTAVGNFTSVNGRRRSQIVRIGIGGAKYALSQWNTTLFTSACSPRFATYMSDVEYSPDGSFLIVSTSGAYGGAAASNNGTSGCDVVARFESGSTGRSTPSWTAYTGGDTTWTVEVTDRVVYAGGHQRWQNNPSARDAAGEGAVRRTGIAALNPENGLPYSWNPTRARGVGVQDMLSTPRGLFVGSDTTSFGSTPGNTYHARIAFLPLGTKLAVSSPVPLPADIYSVATDDSRMVRRSFDGRTVTATGSAPSGPDWSSMVGAFMVNGTLYTADSNGQLSQRSFDGSAYGAESRVDAADALVPQAGWHGEDVPALTSLFFFRGYLYFTRSGTNVLYRRAFEPEAGIVGQQRTVLAAPADISYAAMRGAFIAGGKLYYSTTSGALFRAGWSTRGAVAGTPVQVSGPGLDYDRWSSRALFPYQGASS